MSRGYPKVRVAEVVFCAVLSYGTAFGQTPTTVSLNASPNPAGYGLQVSLTATITPGATGKVTFYDATTILGVGTISGSQASLTTTLLASGTRSLHAHYSGDATYAPSNSSPVSQTIVAGTSLGFKPAVGYPSGTSYAVSVAIGDFNHDNKQDLVVAGYQNSSISILLGNGDGSFLAPAIYTIGGSPSSVVVGDFDGDGNSDLAVAPGPFINSKNSIVLLFGRGDGTFKAPTYLSTGYSPFDLAVGDFNNDGKADLAAGNQVPGAITVLLGNGDGTFQPAVNYASPSATPYVVIGDFNGDGNADLAFGCSSICVFLGNGDGTFQSEVTYPVSSGTDLATGDFNADGKLDLINSTYSYLALLVGNGNGTFQSAVDVSDGGYSRIAVADFNGDGKADWAASSSYYGTLSIGLGNGDGTFQPAVPYPGLSVTGIVVGDFNGDGIADLAAIGSTGSTTGVNVLLGGATPDLAITISHGNGLTAGQTGAAYKLSIGNAGYIGTVGTIGVVATLPPGLTATAVGGGGWTCVLPTLTCTRSDALAPGASYPVISLTVNVGSFESNVTATATVSGGGDGNLTNNFVSDTTFVRYPTTTTLLSAPDPSQLGQSVNLTATVSAGTGKVIFYDGSTVLGVANIAGGHSTLSATSLSSGSHSLTAHYAGDSAFGPSFSNSRLQTVNVLSTTGMAPGGSYSFGPYVATADFDGDGKPDLVSNNGIVLMGKGDGTFQPNAGYVVPSGTFSSVLVGDFNGDGKSDFVLAGANSVGSTGAFYTFLGNGDGTFQAALLTSTAQNVAGAFAADVDQDGKLDLIVSMNNSLSVLLGNGDATFQSPIVFVNGGIQPGYWAVADFNHDGKPDVAYTNSGYGPSVTVLLGIGDGTFHSPVNYAGIGTYVMGFSVGDFNGDGNIDILETYWVGAGVLLGNANGTFQPAMTSSFSSGSSPPWNVNVIGDFNGDGKLDFAYQGYYGANVGIVFGNGNGTFQYAGATVVTSGYGGNLITGDFNRDGRPDLAVANQYGSSQSPTPLNIFLGDQSSGLGLSLSHYGVLTSGQITDYQIVVSNSTYGLTSGTVTVTDTLPPGLTAVSMSGTGWNCVLSIRTCTRADALADAAAYPPILVAVQAGPNLSPSTLTSTASVSWNGIVNSASDPTIIVSATATALQILPNPATQGQAITMTATVSAGTGSVAFFDGETWIGEAVLSGSQAVLTTHSVASGVRRITATYVGDATHGTSRSPSVSLTVNASAVSGFVAGSTPATGGKPIALAKADLDSDGQLDLVTVNLNTNTVSVLMGKGDGTFKSTADYSVDSQPSGLAIADFNGDGKPDLAVVNQSSADVSILLNNGAGGFLMATSIPLGGNASCIIASDLNNDGKTDLVVGCSNSFYVLLGNGDGTFHFLPSTSNSCCGGAIAVGEFNGDRFADVLGSYVFIGNGDGTFASASTVATSASAMAVGDLNGDGNEDVVSVGGPYGSMLALGNGDGTFQPPTNSPFGTNALGITIADVNGDGKPDVVTVGSGVTVWFGAGDGTFPSSISYPTGAVPEGVVAADFNGDGRTDLAVANSGSNSVTILLGVLPPVLSLSSAHAAFYSGETGAAYMINVSNGGPGVTSGTITVIDTLPTGLTATSMTGSGWACTFATLTCIRSDSLGVGATYPAITLTVNVAANAPSLVVNQVTASGGGSPPAIFEDSTSVFTGGPPQTATLISPLNGATVVSKSPALVWGGGEGRTSFDIYFGTTNPPPLVYSDSAGATYYPGTLATGETYYWYVVAKNPAGSTPSPIWSFNTFMVASKIGIFRPAAFMMVAEDVNGNIAWDPGIDRAAFFGTAGDTIIYGDWDGSGTTKVGIFRASVGMFALDMNGNGVWDPGIDTFGFFGQAGDVPIVGDWNGDGRTKVGIYRPTTGLFAIDYNGNLAYDPGIDKAHQFGLVGDTPIIGDWNGDGQAKVGVFRSGLWILDSNNNLTLDAGDTQGIIGQAGDTPLLGDWNGDGRTKVGIYRSGVGMFAEDYNGNLTWDNGVDRAGVFGAAGSTPVVGDWTGTGFTRIGVFYGNGYWGLDINGNLSWDAGVRWGGFGSGTGDTPVVGKW